MALPKLITTELLHLTDALAVARVSVLYGGTQFIGTHYDDASEGHGPDLDTDGRQRKAPITRAVPSLLNVPGVTPATEGDDAVYHIASADPLTVSCGVQDSAEVHIPRHYFTNSSVTYPATLECRLYDAADGSLVDSDTATAASGNAAPTFGLGTPADGSYIAWARLTNVARPYRLPADYRPNLRYQYVESGAKYIYDPNYNIGRLPSNLNHALRLQRAQMVAARTIADKPGWPAWEYLTDGANPTAHGDWSAIKVQVGAGTWTGDAAIFPGPGGPTGAWSSVAGAVATPVAFDHMALSVDAVTVRADGTLLLAGQRLSDTGPVVALWSLDTGVYDLLAIYADYDGSAPRDGAPTTIAEDSAGLVWLLTRRNQFVLDPFGATPAVRLIVSALYPGGESLVLTASAEVQAAEAVPQVAETVTAFADYEGPAYLGPNCLCEYDGTIAAVLQDGPDSSSASKQWLSVLNADGLWTRLNTTGLPAASYRLQHLQRCGTRLFVAGYDPSNNNRPRLLCYDNGKLQEYDCDYRIRQMTRNVEASGAEIVTAVGALYGTDSNNTPHRLISFSGAECVVSQWDGTDRFVASESDYTAVGVDSADLPAYLGTYRAGSQSWRGAGTTPAEPYLQKNITGGNVEYVLHGTLPYSATYWDTIKTCSGQTLGRMWTRDTSAASADDVNSLGTFKYQTFVSDNLAREWLAVQLTDVDVVRNLAANFALYPCCWIRTDSAASQSDLTTYTERLPVLNAYYALRKKAVSKIEAVILAPTGSGGFKWHLQVRGIGE